MRVVAQCQLHIILFRRYLLSAFPSLLSVNISRALTEKAELDKLKLGSDGLL